MNERINMLLSNGQAYYADPAGENDKTFFNIYQKGEFLFTIALNEDGEWESTTDVDPQLVREIGSIIEQIWSRL